MKKLKYHQYIPPDQKGEKSEPPLDSNYARLLQQQQLFLQLQILSQQQQQHYNYQTILPAPLKYGGRGLRGRGLAAGLLVGGAGSLRWGRGETAPPWFFKRNH